MENTNCWKDETHLYWVDRRYDGGLSSPSLPSSARAELPRLTIIPLRLSSTVIGGRVGVSPTGDCASSSRSPTLSATRMLIYLIEYQKSENCVRSNIPIFRLLVQSHINAPLRRRMMTKAATSSPMKTFCIAWKRRDASVSSMDPIALASFVGP